MIVKYLKSYDNSFKKIDKAVQIKAISAIDDLLDFIKTRQKPEGLGLKRFLTISNSQKAFP